MFTVVLSLSKHVAMAQTTAHACATPPSTALQALRTGFDKLRASVLEYQATRARSCPLLNIVITSDADIGRP